MATLGTGQIAEQEPRRLSPRTRVGTHSSSDCDLGRRASGAMRPDHTLSYFFNNDQYNAEVMCFTLQDVPLRARATRVGRPTQLQDLEHVFDILVLAHLLRLCHMDKNAHHRHCAMTAI